MVLYLVLTITLNTSMIRQFLKKKIRNVAVQVFNMEFDVEERDKRPARSTPQAFDQSIIPSIVDGSGDTPGPNHKEKIGRTVISAEIVSGVDSLLIDGRRAFVLGTKQEGDDPDNIQIELWNPEEDYIGWTKHTELVK